MMKPSVKQLAWFLWFVPACAGLDDIINSGDSCRFSNDGQCDEPDVCPPGTDEADCSLCDGCCSFAATDCGPAEVCRFQADDVSGAGDGIGVCVGADSIPYTVSVTGVSLCEADPAGVEWDAFAGAPDPYVVLSVNGTVVASSGTFSDTYNFLPDFEAVVTLRTTDVVALFVYDEDATDDDFGGGFCLGDTCDSPIGIDRLRYPNLVVAEGSCDPGGVASASYSFLPQPN
jgi:hypothetical protein